MQLDVDVVCEARREPVMPLELVLNLTSLLRVESVHQRKARLRPVLERKVISGVPWGGGRGDDVHEWKSMDEDDVDDDEGAERVDVGCTRPRRESAREVAVLGADEPRHDAVDDDGEVTSRVLHRGRDGVEGEVQVRARSVRIVGRRREKRTYAESMNRQSVARIEESKAAMMVVQVVRGVRAMRGVGGRSAEASFDSSLMLCGRSGVAEAVRRVHSALEGRCLGQKFETRTSERGRQKEESKRTSPNLLRYLNGWHNDLSSPSSPSSSSSSPP